MSHVIELEGIYLLQQFRTSALDTFFTFLNLFDRLPRCSLFHRYSGRVDGWIKSVDFLLLQKTPAQQ